MICSNRRQKYNGFGICVFECICIWVELRVTLLGYIDDVRGIKFFLNNRIIFQAAFPLCPLGQALIQWQSSDVQSSCDQLSVK